MLNSELTGSLLASEVPTGRAFSIPETASLPRALFEVGIESVPVFAENSDLEMFGTGDSFEIRRSS